MGGAREASSAFAAADLVLLTSNTEGLPAVLVEAGLRELPVVATDVGYVNEIVVDGDTGILVAPGNRGQVVEAISRVLSDDTEMGAHARLHCSSRFDLETVTDRWDVLLREILATGAPGRSWSDASATPTLTAAGVGRTAPSPRAGSKEQ
jgi:glycosyltransferase involved in cell wall biosynthesis